MKKFAMLLVFSIIIALPFAFASSASSTVLEEAAPGRTYLTANVNQDTINGTDSFAGEECWNLFDGDTTTKFCTNVFPAEVTWQMDTAYLVDAVVIATANDNASYAGRNPATWTFYASSDGVNYVVLHQGTAADLADVNYTYFLVTFDNNIAYPYYKLEISGPESDTAMQMSEFVLCPKIAEQSSYPSSGLAPATGSILGVSLIGNETGWGDSATSGRDAAFDGDTSTFFDPLGVGDGYCGIDCGEPYTLTQVNIHPRDGQLPRYLGAMIQGSDDEANWTTLFTSNEEGGVFEWKTIPASALENNTGYRYYRYFNETSHGDVAEVELYGLSVSGIPEAKAAAAAAAAAAAGAAGAETAAPAAASAQTADIMSVSVAALALAAAAIYFTRKRG